MILTAEQVDAISHCGNLVVTACPGSGKTTVLVHRIIRHLELCRDFQGVVSISFTNKSSTELKTRCKTVVGELKASFFGTTDKFMLREIVMQFIAHLWFRPHQETELVRWSDLETQTKAKLERYFLHAEMENNISDTGMEELCKLYQRGTIVLELLPIIACYVVMHSPACQRYLKARYTGGIYVDEYQDTGFFTHQFFKLLASIGLQLTVVGDAEQSIYLYSHRSSDSLNDFLQSSDFCHKRITLNFRSHPSIINYASRLQDPTCHLQQADELRVYRKKIEGSQKNIAEWIDSVLPAMKVHFSIPCNSEIAILVRSNMCAELIADNLKAPNRAYLDDRLSKIGGRTSELIRALLSYRFSDELTVQPLIDEFLNPTCKRHLVVQTRILMRKTRSCSDQALLDVIKEIVFRCFGVGMAEEHINGIEDALTIQRVRNNYLKVHEDEVQIMTLHKSKGLEFDFVFHLDLYDWVIPIREFVQGSYDVIFQNEQQCLNLHYVGVTRARKAVTLLYSDSRYNTNGQLKRGAPSQFLNRPGLDGLFIKM
ncbi:ATP-dependent helicase [Pluralibacter gergoviae]|uniref:ATP-dependent helicase n=1 Tax=Pluralibacter gergoviae TaxID=61647 RepID=UPI002EDAD3E0